MAERAEELVLRAVGLLGRSPQRLHALAREHLFGDVDRHADDTTLRGIVAAQRRVSDVEEAFAHDPAAREGQGHFRSAKGLSRLQAAPQPVEERIVRHLGDDVLQTSARGVGASELLGRLGVDQLENEIGPPDDVDRYRRLHEKLAQPLALRLGLFPEGADLQVRRHASDELTGRERLHEVIVGAGVQPFHARLLACARREHDDGHRARPGLLTQRSQETEAVEPRHHHVGQHQIRGAPPRRLQGFLAVARRLDAPALAEQPRDVIAHVGIVVHQEDVPVDVPRERLRRESAVEALGHGVGQSGRTGQPAESLQHERRGAAGARGPRGRGRCHLDAIGGQMGVATRQRHPEGRPGSRTALDLDTSAVQPHELLHEREPDAGPFVRARAGALDAVKPLEEAANLGLGDAGSRVADDQLRARRGPA